MDEFFELMVPCPATPSSSRTSLSENEIRSPAMMKSLRLNARKFYRGKRLSDHYEYQPLKYPEESDESPVKKSTPDQAKEENQQAAPKICPEEKRKEYFGLPAEDLNVSSINSVSEENKLSSSAITTDLEEFKFHEIYQQTVHSSPKLVISHFEDSGFLNCSIEISSRLETISKVQEISGQSKDKSLNDTASFEHYMHEGDDDLHSCFEVKKLDSPRSRNVIQKSCDRSLLEGVNTHVS